MATSTLLGGLFKWLFIGFLIVMAVTFFRKDALPDPEYYDIELLKDPIQRKTSLRPFSTQVNGQQYLIKPVYGYELQGIIVSLHDADAFSDIWHHDKWKDFLNLRDLCVIWGENIKSGVYKAMDFSNDSWTCWAAWPDRETGDRFSMAQLSNNHLLADNDDIKRVLMGAEPGDHIRLAGVLASYANPGNGFQRGTSTNRRDTGNGACETIYLQDFEIINKANARMRGLYNLAKWGGLISFLGFLLMFFISPIKRSI